VAFKVDVTVANDIGTHTTFLSKLPFPLIITTYWTTLYQRKEWPLLYCCPYYNQNRNRHKEQPHYAFMVNKKSWMASSLNSLAYKHPILK